MIILRWIMAFVKRTWLARIGTGLNKFIIGEKDAQNKQTLVNDPDSITQEGDTISAQNLNDLEDRIEAGFNDAHTELENGLATRVPTTRKVNGKALSSDISLTAVDIGAPINSITITSQLISAGGDYTLPNMAVGELKFVSYFISTTDSVSLHASQGSFYSFAGLHDKAVGGYVTGSPIFTSSGMANISYDGIIYRYQ